MQTKFSDNMNEFYEIYTIEGEHTIKEIEEELTTLKSDIENKACIDRIYRAVHSLKGSSGFLDFRQMCTLTDAFSNLLFQIHQGNIAINDEVFQILQDAFESLKELFQQIINKDFYEIDLHNIIERLKTSADNNSNMSAVASNNKSIDNSFLHREDLAEMTECFFNDAQNLLGKIAQELPRLKDYPADKNLQFSIFNYVHTIKSGAEFLNFDEIHEVSKHYEILIGKLLNDEIPYHSSLVGVMAEAGEKIEALLQQIGQQQVASSDLEGIIHKMQAFYYDRQPLPTSRESSGWTDIVDLVNRLVSGKERLSQLVDSIEPLQDGSDFIKELAETRAKIDVATTLLVAAMNDFKGTVHPKNQSA